MGVFLLASAGSPSCMLLMLLTGLAEYVPDGQKMF